MCSAWTSPGTLAGHAAGDQTFLVGQRGDVEELGDALPALDLAEQHVAAVRGQREGQGRRDGGLAGAALAGDDVQPDARPVVLLSDMWCSVGRGTSERGRCERDHARCPCPHPPRRAGRGVLHGHRGVTSVMTGSPDVGARSGPKQVPGDGRGRTSRGQGRGKCGRGGRRHPERGDAGGGRVRAVRHPVGADRGGAGRRRRRPRGGLEQLRRRRLGPGQAAVAKRLRRMVSSYVGENKEFARQYLAR